MVDKYFKWKILARILVLWPVSNVSAYHELDQIKKVFVGEILLKQSFWKGIPAKNGNLAEKLIQNWKKGNKNKFQ